MDSVVLYPIKNGGMLILSVVYSFAVFRERPSRDQLIGILLAIVSIVMLSI